MANWSIVYVPFNGDGTVITGGVITMKPAAFYSLIHNVAMGGIAGRVAGTANAAGESAYDADYNNWVGRGHAPAAINTARDTQAAAVAAAAAATTAANAYFSEVFDNIGGVPGHVNNYFTNVILPNIGPDAAANTGGVISGAINTAGSFAYLLLIKYDAIANNNHTNVYYKKYMGNVASPALYNAFNEVHPNATAARTGGYRKQSKKHRRKYSKGRTARR